MNRPTDLVDPAAFQQWLAEQRANLCSRTGSAWATPVCEECRGVGHDEDDGSECEGCEGEGRVPFSCKSSKHRALVAADFVDAHGPLVAMTAVGFHVGIDSEKRAEVEIARAEWATVYRDAFGTSSERTVGVGLAGVTTLAAALRDAVAEAAVQMRERPALVAVAVPSTDERAA